MRVFNKLILTALGLGIAFFIAAAPGVYRSTPKHPYHEGQVVKRKLEISQSEEAKTHHNRW